MSRYPALGLVSLLLAASAEAKPPVLAFVVSCDEEAGSSKICLHGRHAPGKSVLLLKRERRGTCAATTGGTITVTFGTGFEATRLEDAVACGNPDAYHLAVVDKQRVRYKPISLDKIESKAEVERLSSTRQAREALRMAFESARKARGKYFRADLQSLKKHAPLAYRLRGAGNKLSILQYQVKIYDEFIPGPLLIVNRKTVTAILPIVDLCAPKPSAFELNGKRYLLAASDCCECGVVLDRVVELDSSGPKVALETRDFSD